MVKRFITFSILLCLSAMSLASCGKSGSVTASSEAAASEGPTKKSTEVAEYTVKESSGPVSNNMKISLDGKSGIDTSKHESTVNYTDSKSGKICVVSFQDNGHSYEMCISGIKDEFTDDQINTLIGAFLSENPATIESDDLIDAEKFSIYMHGEIGDWVFTDDDFRQVDYDDWGDNDMCWAASISDMLTMSGWAQLAAEKNQDLNAGNVDDLFSYYCSNFPNGNGFFVYDGIDWFLDGGYSGISTDKMPGNLPEYATADYARQISISNGDGIENGVELIKGIKAGDAVGITVDLSQDAYPLKDNSDITVYFSPEQNGYVEDRYDEIDDNTKTVKSAFYVYDDNGKITIVDKKDEDTYVTSDGKEYDFFNVLKGDLYPTDGDSYTLIDDEGNLSYYLIHDREDLDLDNVETDIMIGNGQHAITVSGYVIDTDEDQPADSVKALFIVDSDNDAKYYNMPKDARGNEIELRAKRPNTMQLFRTTPVTTGDPDDGDDSDNVTTLNIEGYLKETYTAIAVITGLKAAPQ